MAIEVCAYPGGDANALEIGGEDAGEDLVIHYAADGLLWLREIEHASADPEHIVQRSRKFASAQPDAGRPAEVKTLPTT
jgi:hypothetical protein